ncbi:MAG: HEAT repeat domain-containing protein, partial [Planctomycetaceae bacterium]|nr:HEAT repeat domain-containing protein [Planctomycetaceae bacterium]
VAIVGGLASTCEPQERFLLTTEAASEREYDGHTVDEWREAIKSIDFQSRTAAEAVPGLIELVQDHRLPWFTRKQAALTLGRIGRPAESAVPVLIVLLAEPDHSEGSPTADWAAKALSLFGPVAAPAAPALADLLDDVRRSHLDRLSSVEALARIGTAHEAAVPALIRQADRGTEGEIARGTDTHDAGELCEAAVDGLAIVGAAAAPAVPALIRMSREDSSRLRKKAAVALGGIGPAAEIAAQALTELALFDDSPEVRGAAGASLAAIGDSGELALRKLLNDQDAAVRLLAAESMKLLPRRNERTVTALRTSLHDVDATVRIAAAESLWKLTRFADPLFPIIFDLLTTEDRQQRIRAYRLLISLGPAAGPVLPELQRLTRDARPHVRQVAEKSLAELAEVIPNKAAGDASTP